MSDTNAPAPRGRIDAIDMARGLALLAMAVYHFAWDLEFFQYVERGMTGHGGWRIFARAIASSFLFLVGVGLVLAHGRGIRWRPFAIRLAQIACGAAAITLVTVFATPASYVYFGILHHIAVASLLGLLFLRVPPVLTALVALGVLVLPQVYSNPVFDPKWLNWIGLHSTPPFSNDFVPIFPFFAAVLFGIAAARLGQRSGLFERLRAANTRLARVAPLAWLGRHSLAFYLLHQPVLIALVYLGSLVLPPDPSAMFQSDCRAQCLVNRDAAFCQAYCACAEGELRNRGVFDSLMAGTNEPNDLQTVREVVEQCSFQTETPGN